jgi:hypothetical protein
VVRANEKLATNFTQSVARLLSAGCNAHDNNASTPLNVLKRSIGDKEAIYSIESEIPAKRRIRT